jgi:hypothetical protein
MKLTGQKTEAAYRGYAIMAKARAGLAVGVATLAVFP